jgi:hypothetical protein
MRCGHPDCQVSAGSSRQHASHTQLLLYCVASSSSWDNTWRFAYLLVICRPKTLDDVAEAVRLHDHVKANGEGHSWNRVRDMRGREGGGSCTKRLAANIVFAAQ